MENVLRKNDLVRAMAKETGMTLKDTESVLETLLETIKEVIAKGDSVSLYGFGKFETYMSEERKGVNPATREEITIPARRRIRFKAGSELKKAAKGE